MEQVPLDMLPRLAYSADKFVMHAGVRQDWEKCLALLGQSGFRLCFFTSQPGGGKTHFALRLAQDLEKRKLKALMLTAPEFSRFCRDRPAVDHETVLIVDDAEQYFSALTVEEEGNFVAAVEQLRQEQAGMVFLSSLQLEQFTFDEHVRSRLLPGQGFCLGPPQEQDMQPLVTAMLEQRGLNIPARKIDFMLRRLPRSIAGISAFASRIQHLTLHSRGSLDYSVLDSCL